MSRSTEAVVDALPATSRPPPGQGLPSAPVGVEERIASLPSPGGL